MANFIINKILASDSKVQAGVYLQTSDDIIADQKTWDDGDASKDVDFSGSDYWITTDDGQDPIGIDSDEELWLICPDSDFFKKKGFIKKDDRPRCKNCIFSFLNKSCQRWKRKCKLDNDFVGNFDVCDNYQK